MTTSAELTAPAVIPAGHAPPRQQRPLRVLHVITRMIVGGAQENTMLSCALMDPDHVMSTLVTGVETGVEGELLTESRLRGIPLVIEPRLVRRLSPWSDIVATYRLWRIMRGGRFDVVHTHTSKAGVVGRVAAWFAGVPVVVHTAHGWGFTPLQPRPLYWLYVWLERVCSSVSDIVVAVASTNRDDALALGIGRPEQYRLIRSGIELGCFRDVPISRTEVRRSLGLPDDAFVVGSVGRLGDQKAPLDLLHAFAPVAAAHPEARLVFVGDGPLRGQLEAAIAAEGLTGRVLLTGLRRDVPELLRAFDVFALASRWEGLPRVFPQAMAAGLPIVATRVDGAPDAVIQGVNGWLVPVGDLVAMSARLSELAADPVLARRMGAAGLERVEEFSAQAMVDALAGLYDELAARTKRG
ncbi:MAG: glycosyltransferase family 4 protein [Candidatus Eisenbacteria bacterium]